MAGIEPQLEGLAWINYNIDYDCRTNLQITFVHLATHSSHDPVAVDYESEQWRKAHIRFSIVS